jgi:enediyne biosynthesis protein E4
MVCSYGLSFQLSKYEGYQVHITYQQIHTGIGVISISMILAFLIFLPMPLAAQFIDVTVGPLGDNGQGFGAAWGDYDNDGDPDIYLSNDASINVLLRNDDGVFDRITADPLGDDRSGRSAAWGDYDNDGDLDLYLTNRFSSNLLLRNDGTDEFTDITSEPLEGNSNSYGTIWGDFNQDGYLDLYLINSGSPNQMLCNDSNDNFVDVTNGPLGDDEWGYTVAAGDYDNDGDLDIYLPKSGGQQNVLLRNDGNFVFTDVTSFTLGDFSAGMGVAWGDYDNDGDLDLCYTNLSAPCRLWRNDGDDVFVDVASGPLSDPNGAFSLAFADWDNDGDLDLYLGKYGEANQLLRNDNGIFVDATSGPLGNDGNTRGVAWADYDNDGDLDLYLSSYLTPNQLLQNEGAGNNHWLQVKLQGTTSNRAGIGARIQVHADGVSRIREISGGSGYLSQNDLVASFGLGSATTVDSVIVFWPSGLVQVVEPTPDIDQKILIIENNVSAVDGQIPVSKHFSLGMATPNPFNPATKIAYEIPNSGHVRLEVLDVTGRLVRSLVNTNLPAGQHEVSWNGKDDAGNRVSSGVYLYRILTGGFSQTRRVVLVK